MTSGALIRTTCDGDHAAPACGDPECWHNEEPSKRADQARQRRQKAFLDAIAETRKLYVELGDRLARLEEIATSGQTSTRALVVEFRTEWEKKTGDKYIPNEAQDSGTMRRLLKHLSAAEIRSRRQRYFAMSEPFVRQARYSMQVFASLINSLSGRGDAAPGVAGRRSVLEQSGWLDEGD